MDRNSSTERTPLTSLTESFERYLQDKGKGRGGDGRGIAGHERVQDTQRGAGTPSQTREADDLHSAAGIRPRLPGADPTPGASTCRSSRGGGGDDRLRRGLSLHGRSRKGAVGDAVCCRRVRERHADDCPGALRDTKH